MSKIFKLKNVELDQTTNSATIGQLAEEAYDILHELKTETVSYIVGGVVVTLRRII